MAVQRLDGLPIEVLQAICHVLDTSHKQSVASFSVVNQACRRAAGPTLFRVLNVRITSPQQLADDVQKWNQTLLANDAFKSVRQLRISGDIYRHLRDQSHEQNSSADGKQPKSFDDEESWLPLAHLIEKTPGLKDLHFLCNTTFPPCLLNSLSNTSSCRLHITNFSLEGLRQPVSTKFTEPLELSASDLALITSPYLYAVSFSSSFGTTSSRVDYTPEAIFELAARGCPALKEVEIIQKRTKASPRTKSKKPFSGLKLDEEAHPSIRPPGAKAKLTSLTLRGRQPQLEEWQQYTDFDVLEELRLTGDFDPSVLKWAAKSASFPALSTVEVHVPRNDETSITRLLESLPALEDLALVGQVDIRTIRVITNNHGMTLRRLSLPGLTCKLDYIVMFRDACPLLEHFATTIPRTQSDAKEVAIYNTLGLFASLRSLHLNLDCIAGVEHFDGDKATQHVLANCAVDSTLAASIFDCIASAKPPGSMPLENVELNVVRAADIVSREDWNSQQERDRVYGHFTRTWMCSIHPRDDCQGEAIVEETKGSLLAREKAESIGDQPPKLGELQGAFRALWPDRTSSDWRDDWKGFPLQS